MTRSAPARQRGFALITALWAAVVLALLTGSITAMSNTGRRSAHGAARSAELDAAAEGAIAMVELELLAPGIAARVPTDGAPFDVACCGHTVRIVVQDEGGLVDLNMASDVSLRRLLEVAGGADPEMAQVLADRIIDWREPGASKRLNGAKADDYRAAGYTYGPREGPFATREELKLVMGITRALFDKLGPAVTVSSQSPAVDPDVAPGSVLSLAPGMTPDVVQAVLQARDDRQHGETEIGAPRTDTLVGHAVQMSATVTGPSGTTAIRTLSLRLVGPGLSPFWVY